MAKHKTHKATMSGKVRTRARQQARADKYRTTPFDAARLERELSR